MAWSRPTLARLKSRILADIEAVLQNGAVYIRRSFERAIGVAMAGLAHSMHGHLGWIAKQIIIDTADDEYLVRWASIFGQPRLQAVKAEFDITVTGTATLPAGYTYSSLDDVVYEVLTETDIVASGTVTIRALNAGENGNIAPGATLTLQTPIVGISPDALVNGSGSDLIGGGSDIETINALRARLLNYIQNPPKGGASGDWVIWAKEASASVTRAWEFANQLGPNTVLVLFVQDTFDEDGFFIDTVFPGGAEIDTVREYIDTKKNISVNGYVPDDYVAAPTEQTLNPQIYMSPNTEAVQLQVTRHLQDLLLREASPGGTLAWSKINEAISLAQGEEDHDLTDPTEDVATTAGVLLTLGAIDFQDL
jgi:uncharacterized phage protein gp47/JayE